MTTPTEAWSCWPAPAKVNRFLHIVGRRDDGYHRLQTVFQLLDWGDEIALRPRADGVVTRADGAVDYGVAGEDDLVVRAARLLQSTSSTVQGVDIRVDKRIPPGGGFGGGSSDAATVLVALNHLWRTGLPVAELALLGLQLGADVPVFVAGHSAFAEGVGEQLTPLSLPARWFLLIDAGIHLATAELFGDPELTRDSPALKISGFLDGSDFEGQENAFEPLVLRRYPQLAALFDAMRSFGRPRLTGTGGGSFMVFRDREAAEDARQALPRGIRGVVARGLNRSPLYGKLETGG
ncbi:MAG: 4-(cytidine 5'-diphospho)-2-C-methyl-D-erythritol kinase [Xanthomonadales bacterium]|nr:4-(cytidine 5'-diphospho)-2-C-methyl-D-erythritol kinase [Xanthomonadales bacterium]